MQIFPRPESAWSREELRAAGVERLAALCQCLLHLFIERVYHFWHIAFLCFGHAIHQQRIEVERPRHAQHIGGVTQFGADTLQLLLQQHEDASFKRIAQHHVVDLDGVGLPPAVHAPIALFQAVRVPG